MTNHLKRLRSLRSVLGLSVAAAALVGSTAFADVAGAAGSATVTPGTASAGYSGTSQNYGAANHILVGSGSSTTYPMMVSLDALFNQAPGCTTVVDFASATAVQPLNFSCLTPAATTNGLNLSPTTAAAGVTPNPYNDVAVEETPLGSSVGVSQLVASGGSAVTYNGKYTSAPAANLSTPSNINFARSSRGTKSYDARGLNFVAYAADGISWVHYSKVKNKVTNSDVAGLTTGSLLSLAELSGIYSGSVYNWSQVGGGNGPVIVFSSQEGSGTQDTFKGALTGAYTPSGLDPSNITNAVNCYNTTGLTFATANQATVLGSNVKTQCAGPIDIFENESSQLVLSSLPITLKDPTYTHAGTASTTLTANASSGDTTVTVASVTGITATITSVTIGSEAPNLVTGISGTTLTLTSALTANEIASTPVFFAAGFNVGLNALSSTFAGPVNTTLNVTAGTYPLYTLTGNTAISGGNAVQSSTATAVNATGYAAGGATTVVESLDHQGTAPTVSAFPIPPVCKAWYLGCTVNPVVVKGASDGTVQTGSLVLPAKTYSYTATFTLTSLFTNTPTNAVVSQRIMLGDAMFFYSAGLFQHQCDLTIGAKFLNGSVIVASTNTAATCAAGNFINYANDPSGKNTFQMGQIGASATPSGSSFPTLTASTVATTTTPFSLGSCPVSTKILTASYSLCMPTEASILAIDFAITRKVSNVYANGSTNGYHLAATTVSNTTPQGAGDTTLTVQTASSIPLPPLPFTIQVTTSSVAEKEQVTAVDNTGLIWTVTRGTLGTTAASHNSADPVDIQVVPTATDATLNYVSESGFLCSPLSAIETNPATGNTYLKDIQNTILNSGFFPLSGGQTSGTVNSVSIPEGSANVWASSLVSSSDQYHNFLNTANWGTLQVGGQSITSAVTTATGNPGVTSGTPNGYCIASNTDSSGSAL